KPMVFGKDRNKGVRLRGLDLEVVTLGNGVSEKDLLVHDESAEEPTLAFLLSRMTHPEFPEPMGVFRKVRRPTYDELVNQRGELALRARGRGNGENWFAGDDVGVVGK